MSRPDGERGLSRSVARCGVGRQPEARLRYSAQVSGLADHARAMASQPAIQPNAGTIGTAGGASAGGTWASSVGTVEASQTDDGTTSSIGSGGSAATDDSKANSKTVLNDNGDKPKAQTNAQADDKGTFSKSRTKTSTDGTSAAERDAHHVARAPARSP